MDPLTAFGLAANVVSFISFASDLIKTTAELYRSDSGTTADFSSLERIYGDLGGLSRRLEHTCRQPSAQETVRQSVSLDDHSVEQTMLGIKTLAELCKEDCDELLSIIDNLRPQRAGDPKSKWKSFRKALDKFRKEGDITRIKESLHQRQTTLSLYIGTIYGYHQKGLAKLQSQSVELQIDQNKTIEEVKDSLTRCERMLTDAHNERDHERIQLGNYESLGQLFKALRTTEAFQGKLQRFMQTLQFEARPRRYEAIAEAHEQTFRWLLGDEITDQTLPNPTRTDNRGKSALAQWLESKNGIFWVSGKPGSGKSTFMKFVAGATRTTELLTHWASPTIIVSHYFWNSGSPIQMSREGLLRSLLYDIFRQCPDLIPVLCEERWKELDNPKSPSRTWSLANLTGALKKITMEDTQKRMNFCFFIDGLDEFEGGYDDQFELCEMMRELARSQHIKICVSSRPWNLFEDAFGTGSKMYIHDYTRKDIRNYASCRLRDHPRWIDLPTSNAAGGQWLIDEIVNRCDGVFLWAVLVTKLLREGMTNRDRFSDLCRRLESFPRELGPFFRHILDSVEPIYHEKMATMLQITLIAEKPLHMILYDFHDLEHDDEYYYRSKPIQPLTAAELSDVRSRMICYLDSRTKGLLELPGKSREVTFLHRSVKDYLADQALLGASVVGLPRDSCRNFCPQLSILRAYAAWIKCAVPDIPRHPLLAEDSDFGATDGITPSILELTTDLIPYAVQLDPQSPNDTRIGEALDDIGSSIALLISRVRASAGRGSWSEEAGHEDKIRHDHIINFDILTFQKNYAWAKALFFRERLANAGVTNYIAAKELEESAMRKPQANERSLSDNPLRFMQTNNQGSLRGKQHRLTHDNQFNHTMALFRLFRCLLEVNLIILRWFLFLLYPFIFYLSSFLIKFLPSFFSQFFIIPFMSILVKFLYGYG